MADTPSEGTVSTMDSVLSLCKNMPPDQLAKVMANLQDLSTKDTAQASKSDNASSRTNTMTSSPISTGRHSLLTLPAELRNAIYRELLVPVSKPLCFLTQRGGKKKDVSILCTCRQIHQEATALLYTEAALYIVAFHGPSMAACLRESKKQTNVDTEPKGDPKLDSINEDDSDSNLESKTLDGNLEIDQDRKATETESPPRETEGGASNAEESSSESKTGFDSDILEAEKVRRMTVGVEVAVVNRWAADVVDNKTSEQSAVASVISTRFRKLLVAFLLSPKFPNEEEYIGCSKYLEFMWQKHSDRHEGNGQLDMRFVWRAAPRSEPQTQYLAPEASRWKRVDTASSSLIWSLKRFCGSKLQISAVSTSAVAANDGEQLDMFYAHGDDKCDFKLQSWDPQKPLPSVGVRLRFRDQIEVVDSDMIGDGADDDGEGGEGSGGDEHGEEGDQEGGEDDAEGDDMDEEDREDYTHQGGDIEVNKGANEDSDDEDQDDEE